MNVDRLIQTLNHILEHPETWNQRVWHCETSHCFAGHGQINSGKEINDATCFEDAREWYGLSDDDARWLFNTRRTLPEIYAFVKAAKDGAVFFDEDGYDHEGYDRFGYDHDEYDREGKDRFGYDRAGYDRDGYDQFGFNRDGCDRAGFNRDGYDREGTKLPTL